MARETRVNSLQQQSQLLPRQRFNIQSKEIGQPTLFSSNDVKTLRDIFIYGEKHCEPKSFDKMAAWINEEHRKTKKVTTEFQSTGSFLKGLRGETVNGATYNFIPSPEFKPGKVFVLPDNKSSHEYNAVRHDRCVSSYTYIQRTNQLCRNNITRKAFCEVVGNNLCVDCNGRQLREKFNVKINSLYPYLEYDKAKRPYGYCPRTIRLTEPLPSKQRLTNPSARANTNFNMRGIQGSGIYNEEFNVFIKSRPHTT